MGDINVGDLHSTLKLDISDYQAAEARAREASKALVGGFDEVSVHLQKVRAEFNFTAMSAERFNQELSALQAKLALTTRESVALLTGPGLVGKPTVNAPHVTKPEFDFANLQSLSGPIEINNGISDKEKAAKLAAMEKDVSMRRKEIMDRDMSGVIEIEREEKEAARQIEEAWAAMEAERVAADKLAKAQIKAMDAEAAAASKLQAKQEAEMWAAHEAEEVAVTKAADKAKVEADAQSNAARAAQERALARERQVILEAGEAKYLTTVRAARAEEAVMRQTATNAGYLLGGYPGGHAARTLGGLGMLGHPAVLGGLAAGFSVYEIGKITTTAAEAARETSNLAAELNITWQQARRLQEVAVLTGISLSTLQQVSGRLAEVLSGSGEGGRQTVKVLNDIGVTGRDSGEILLNFLTQLSKISDSTERLAVAREVLRRSSYLIEPAVKELGGLNEVLDRLGTGLKDPNKLTQAQRNIKELELAWTHLKEAVAENAAPTVATAAEKMTQLMTKAPEGARSNLLFPGSFLINPKLEAEDKERRKKKELDAQEAAKGTEEANKREIEADRKAAKDWEENFAKTIEGRKRALQIAHTEIAKLQEELASSPKVLTKEERAEKEKKLKDLTGKTALLEAREYFREDSSDLQRAAEQFAVINRARREGQISESQYAADTEGYRRKVSAAMEEQIKLEKQMKRELEDEIRLLDEFGPAGARNMHRLNYDMEHAMELLKKLKDTQRITPDDFEDRKNQIRTGYQDRVQDELLRARRDAVEVFDQFGPEGARNLNKMADDFDAVMNRLQRMRRDKVLNEAEFTNRVNEAQQGYQNRITIELEAARKAAFTRTFEPLQELGVNRPDMSGLLADLQKVDALFSRGTIDLQELTSAYNNFWKITEEKQFGPGLEEAISEFEHGLITASELDKARERSRAMDHRRQAEQMYKEGKISAGELMRFSGGADEELFRNRAFGLDRYNQNRIKNTQPIPEWMHTPRPANGPVVNLIGGMYLDQHAAQYITDEVARNLHMRGADMQSSNG